MNDTRQGSVSKECLPGIITRTVNYGHLLSIAMDNRQNGIDDFCGFLMTCMILLSKAFFPFFPAEPFEMALRLSRWVACRWHSTRYSAREHKVHCVRLIDPSLEYIHVSPGYNRSSEFKLAQDARACPGKNSSHGDAHQCVVSSFSC